MYPIETGQNFLANAICRPSVCRL